MSSSLSVGDHGAMGKDKDLQQPGGWAPSLRIVCTVCIVVSLGTLSYMKQQHQGGAGQGPKRWVPPPPSHHHHLAMMEHEEEHGGSESLEAALARLEGRQAMASTSPAAPAAAASKRSKKDRTSKKQEQPPRRQAPRSATELGEVAQKLVEDEAPPFSAEELEAAQKAMDAEAAEHEKSHMDFAERLKKEVDQKFNFTLSSVKKDFAKSFGGDAPKLLCSGCKLVAARLTKELSEHDVNEQESPALMLEKKRMAIDSTCKSFAHLQVTTEDGSSRFEERETPSEKTDPLMLCRALLEDAKFSLLTKLIQKKVPGSPFHNPTTSSGDNWERFLCAQHSRVCKRSEVRDDDEDEEDQEDQEL